MQYTFKPKTIVGEFQFKKAYHGINKHCAICTGICENGKVHIKFSNFAWMHINCVLNLHKHVKKSYNKHKLEIFSEHL